MTGRRRFLTLYVLIAAAAFFIHFHSPVSVPENRPFSQFPAAYHGWHMLSQFYMSEAVLEQLKPTDYLNRSYVSSDGIPVLLYIGYSSGGKGSGPVHSPEHCLPGGGWHERSGKAMTIAVPGGKKEKISLVSSVYQNGENKNVIFYWYRMKGGRTLTNDYVREFYEVLNSMLYGRRDVALIRVMVPFSSDRRAAAAEGIRFIKDVYPEIEQFLPR